MAQHDYVIDNSTGANVRADINNALLAISSNNSGSSAPSTTYALQSFANTTNSMLQLRNAANNAFVNLRKFDGTLPLPDGSASSPSLFFDDDTNTGLFSSAADNLDISTGGSVRANFSSTGLSVTGAITTTSDITIPDKIIHSSDTNTAIRFPAADTVSVETNGSERARIDSAGRFLVGTSTARAVGGSGDCLLEIEGVNAKSAISIIRNQSSSAGPALSFGKTRGGSVGGTTVVQSGDKLGTIRFNGADGTDLVSDAASIVAEVDGTPGANDMPGRLVFSTTADGSEDPTTRLTIDSAGTSTFTGNIETSGTLTVGGSTFATDGTLTTTESITIQNAQPGLSFVDTGANPDFIIQNRDGLFAIRDTTNNVNRFLVNMANGEVTTTGSILPDADNTDALGSSSKRFTTLHSAALNTGDINMSNLNDSGNEVDGSKGSWTLQEGADDLFIINRVSGKKYKFNLTEIS